MVYSNPSNINIAGRSVTSNTDLAVTDNRTIITFNSASSIALNISNAIDATLPLGFTCYLVNVNTGGVTFSLGASVNLYPSNTSLAQQYHLVQLTKYGAGAYVLQIPTQDNNAKITSGSIDNTTIGSTTPSSSSFTTLKTTGAALVETSSQGTITSSLVSSVPSGTTNHTQVNLVLSGQEFYQDTHFSNDGVAFVCGVNRTGNRQLWIGDSAAMSSSATNGVIRITPSTTLNTIDSYATDGTTVRPLYINGNSIVLQNSGANVATVNLANLEIAANTGILFDNTTTSYVAGTLDYYEVDSLSTVSASGAVATGTLTFRFTRIGKQVFISWPNFSFTATASSILTFLSACPNRFKPGSSDGVNIGILVQTNTSTYSMGIISIGNSGQIDFSVNGLGTFTNGNACAVIGGTTTYWTL